LKKKKHKLQKEAELSLNDSSVILSDRFGFSIIKLFTIKKLNFFVKH